MKKCIFLFIMFICFMCKVNANESANININWVPNVYVNYIKDGVPHWSQFAYLYDNNKLLYCMEINKSIVTNIYKAYSFSDESLSFDLKRDLELINYYGYQYEGHKSLYYYMATQELIWNRLGSEIYWTTESNGMGSIINVSQYKEEIMNLYNNYFDIPSFDSSISDTRVGSSREFNDNNNVLYKYEVKYNGENIIRVQNNKIIIDSYKLGLDTFNLKRKLNDIGESIIYKKDNSQTLIHLGNVEDAGINYNFTVHGGTILIRRLDSLTMTNTPFKETSLGNAMYYVYDSIGNIVNSGMTDPYGAISFNNMPLGDYIIKEDSPSMGYELDDKEYHVSLTFGDVDETINPIVSVIERKLEINMIYQDIGSASSVTFDIYNKDDFVNSVTTNSNGYASIYLPYGIYTVKQSNNKEGYLKVSDFEFVVGEDDITTYNLYSEKEFKEPIQENDVIEKSVDVIIEDSNQERLPLLFERNYNAHICYGLTLLSIIIKLLMRKHA